MDSAQLLSSRYLTLSVKWIANQIKEFSFLPILPTPQILSDKHFLVEQGNERTDLNSVYLDVSQGSVLRPNLHLMYTAGLPIMKPP